MFARVKIEFGVNKSVMVPEESVVKMQGTGQRCVYVLQPDNTVERPIVNIGRHFEDMYEILDGLSGGETVVTKGSVSLKDGAKVEVSNK